MNETDACTKYLQQLKEASSLARTEIVDALTGLRNLCARSNFNQIAVCNDTDLTNYLHSLIFDVNADEKLQKLALQVLANSIVDNPEAQKIAWACHGTALLEKCALPPVGTHSDIMLMIIYNIYIRNNQLVSPVCMLQAAVHVWAAIVNEKCERNFDFLHIIFEHFLTKEGRCTANIYSKLSASDRIMFLDYLANYLRQDSPNGKIHELLIQFLSKMFKIQSDCLLRQSNQNSDNYNAREVYNLLRCIASATGSEQYTGAYAKDHSLFLNVSGLLRCIIAAGKEDTPNIFTPMEKLDEVAPNSQISYEFQKEISYDMKTLLMRCIANSLYSNSKNKEYCIDTQLIPAILECTKRDARNPLLHEWSILALRNACENCPQIQEIIAGITNEGPAPNDMLNELNLSMGAMRIKPGHK